MFIKNTLKINVKPVRTRTRQTAQNREEERFIYFHKKKL